MVLELVLKELKGAGIVDETKEIKRLYKTRVPLLKFVDSSTGIDCDITVGNSEGIFKSFALQLLIDIDARMAALVRLVKAWAKAQDINCAQKKTFNSYALTMMAGKLISPLLILVLELP